MQLPSNADVDFLALEFWLPARCLKHVPEGATRRRANSIHRRNHIWLAKAVPAQIRRWVSLWLAAEMFSWLELMDFPPLAFMCHLVWGTSFLAVLVLYYDLHRVRRACAKL